MQFISAASNLRAYNYGLDPVDSLETKRIAGKIIPAISTTTSVVAGLICMELYKLFDDGGWHDRKRFKDSFVSLANPQLLFVPPGQPVTKVDGSGVPWSIWSSPFVDATEGDMTLAELSSKLQEMFGIEISILSYGDWVLFGSFMSKEEQDDVMGEHVLKLIERVSSVKIGTETKSIKLSVLSGAEIHANVSIPPIKYVIAK